MKERYIEWMNEFMEGWKNLDYERVLKTISETCEYYENPLDEPCTDFEDIRKLWEVVKDNQKNISYKFEVVVSSEKAGIINFQMERILTNGEIHQEIDGIFEIKLDEKGKCTYFKQWRFTREK